MHTTLTLPTSRNTGLCENQVHIQKPRIAKCNEDLSKTLCDTTDQIISTSSTHTSLKKSSLILIENAESILSIQQPNSRLQQIHQSYMRFYSQHQRLCLASSLVFFLFAPTPITAMSKWTANRKGTDTQPHIPIRTPENASWYDGTYFGTCMINSSTTLTLLSFQYLGSFIVNKSITAASRPLKRIETHNPKVNRLFKGLKHLDEQYNHVLSAFTHVAASAFLNAIILSCFETPSAAIRQNINIDETRNYTNFFHKGDSSDLGWLMTAYPKVLCREFVEVISYFVLYQGLVFLFNKLLNNPAGLSLFATRVGSSILAKVGGGFVSSPFELQRIKATYQGESDASILSVYTSLIPYLAAKGSVMGSVRHCMDEIIATFQSPKNHIKEEVDIKSNSITPSLNLVTTRSP